MASFVDEGMPSVRDEWPQGTLEGLEQFRQGDVIPSPLFVFFGSPGAPLTRTSKRYGQSHSADMPMMVDPVDAAPWAMITTATCDIAEPDVPRPRKPFAQVAPVVDLAHLGDGQRGQIANGNMVHYVHLPALHLHTPGFWVADLRFDQPVEKSWLARQRPVQGFGSEVEQEVVGEALSWLRRRPAMGSAFIEHVQQPVNDALESLRRSDKALWKTVDREIAEWAVACDSRLEPTRAKIVLLSTAEAPSSECVRWWRETVDRLRASAEKTLIITGPEFQRLDVITVTEYRELTVLGKPHRSLSKA
ncbi:hypothetical protein [Streptomyces natalensis]|uniref:Uncharacterized protein n=1 Tax=Streptomyces natalensis ATCC 27448 TaxID=1240678 RepID=A0A0D7CG62_9ACTN|nr:hypothetical protein [Streptomyces natalensis]KIZ15026.1 hypothetical protein SNA_29250 [Streptomyces natalensis ATCC 27448]